MSASRDTEDAGLHGPSASVGMTRQVLVDDLRGLLSHYTGLPIGDIREDSELYQDLGIAGDDGYDLFVMLRDRYNADFSSLDLDAYFGDEAALSLQWLFWPVWYCIAFFFGKTEPASTSPEGSITVAIVADHILAARGAKPEGASASSVAPPTS
jgi:hypothetical protein